jgi:hypothetical protein
MASWGFLRLLDQLRTVLLRDSVLQENSPSIPYERTLSLYENAIKSLLGRYLTLLSIDQRFGLNEWPDKDIRPRIHFKRLTHSPRIFSLAGFPLP